MLKPKALPSRFPVGTKFVIEGKPAGEGEVQVFKRYIEFPDGTLMRLPVGAPSRQSARKSTRKSTRKARTPVQRSH